MKRLGDSTKTKKNKKARTPPIEKRRISLLGCSDIVTIIRIKQGITMIPVIFIKKTIIAKKPARHIHKFLHFIELAKNNKPTAASILANVSSLLFGLKPSILSCPAKTIANITENGICRYFKSQLDSHLKKPKDKMTAAPSLIKYRRSRQ